MMRRLALITGGTSGIGLGIAKQLAAEYDLALGYASNHERAESAKKQLQAAGATNVKLFAGNLRRYEDAKQLISLVKEQFGCSPQVLIHSAGRIRDDLFLGSDFSEHEELIQEHLLVSMALSHLTLKDMYKEQFGRIVHISSISAHFSKKGQTSYAAAKAGLEGFTRVLALEVAHRKITVNAVAPGLIETPMTAKIVGKIRSEEGGIERKIPAGFVGHPDDVGQLVKFLCSEAAQYITGSTFTIDGGRSLGDVER